MIRVAQALGLTAMLGSTALCFAAPPGSWAGGLGAKTSPRSLHRVQKLDRPSFLDERRREEELRRSEQQSTEARVRRPRPAPSARVIRPSARFLSAGRTSLTRGRIGPRERLGLPGVRAAPERRPERRSAVGRVFASPTGVTSAPRFARGLSSATAKLESTPPSFRRLQEGARAAPPRFDRLSR